MLIRIENNPTHKFAHKSYGVKNKQKMVHAVEALLAYAMSIKESCDIVHVPWCLFYSWKKTVSLCNDKGRRTSASRHTAVTSKMSINGEISVSAKTTDAIGPVVMTVTTKPAIATNNILMDVFDNVSVAVVNQFPSAVPTLLVHVL